MIEIKFKDGELVTHSEGSQKDLAVETVTIVQALAKGFAKMFGLSENDAVDVIADSAKHMMGRLNECPHTEIHFPGVGKNDKTEN